MIKQYQDSIKTNILRIFDDDWVENVALLSKHGLTKI
jgi:hypothetical protein